MYLEQIIEQKFENAYPYEMDNIAKDKILNKQLWENLA